MKTPRNKVSPLAPTAFPKMGAIDGVKLGAIESGIKYRGRDDLMLAVLESGATAAGVLTQSTTASAPVLWCRQQLDGNTPRALIVNAGNANTFTGEVGERHVVETCNAVAAAIGCDPEQVLVASTGVIGETLPMDKIIDALPKLAASLSTDAWQRAATAITTTDTFIKGASAYALIDGVQVSINGFAKGSGMIEPNMATLLAFLFTDAVIPHAALQSMLVAANEQSFNAISVDGDTSTSDTCILFATGKANNPASSNVDDLIYEDFKRALQQVMVDLAIQIVCDGEGAQKLITIKVRGAEDDRAAKVIAKSIANSPLVKTAIAGEDANWGRIVMAIGKSGERVEPTRLEISIGGTPVTEHGKRIDDFDESPLNQHLKGEQILIEVNLGLADGSARVWTCDLTHGYIDINADYRT